MAISGIISFLSNDANALPVSTTKTGIELESEVYIHALNACATGLKLFTSFTDKWKGRVKETSKYFEAATRRDAISEVDLAATKGRKVADLATQYKPDLPLPPTTVTERRITFVRSVREIALLSDFFFNEARSPSEVGEECFSRCLAKAKKG
jgi:hypothetical protein